jgi:hypothetical protein
VAVPALIVALDDRDSAVRQVAAWGLEQIGTPDAVAAVEAWRQGQQGGSDTTSPAAVSFGQPATAQNTG